MRDRLIEILKTPIYPKIGVDPAEVVADYLLANGVILPPCKVGDMVYTVGVFTGQVLSQKVVAINYGDEGLYLLLDGFTVVSVTEQLGKTVFLTKEEAEAKLKEREGK